MGIRPPETAPNYGIMRPVNSEPTTPKLDETIPQSTVDFEPESSQPAPAPSGGSRRRRLVIIFLAYIAALVGIGLLAYFQGRGLNSAEHVAQVSEAMAEQYELGVEDLDNGQYELARQRFEAIISFDPEYPGAEDMLVEALVHLNVPTITPTSEPTPDKLQALDEALKTSGYEETPEVPVESVPSLKDMLLFRRE